MANLDGWDWAILVVASYVAVMSLARLMRSHHDWLVGQLRERIEKDAEAPRPRSPRPDDPSTAPADGQRTDAA